MWECCDIPRFGPSLILQSSVADQTLPAVFLITNSSSLEDRNCCVLSKRCLYSTKSHPHYVALLPFVQAVKHTTQFWACFRFQPRWERPLRVTGISNRAQVMKSCADFGRFLREIILIPLASKRSCPAGILYIQPRRNRRLGKIGSRPPQPPLSRCLLSN